MLKKAGRAPLEAAREYASGRRAVGHMLTDAPVELLHAAGFFPVQIHGHYGPAGPSSRELQSFACSYSRGSVDLLLDGSFDFLEGVVIPFICDTTRCVDIVLRGGNPFKFVEAYRPPKSLTGPGARDYLVGEIRRLKGRLEQIAGHPITNSVLWRSIGLYNRARGLLKNFEILRADDPQAYFDICRAFTVLPVDLFIGSLQKAFSELRTTNYEKALMNHAATSNPAIATDGPTDQNKVEVPIMLAGKIPEPLDLPQALKSMGVRIVADDLAMGARLFTLIVEEEGDPVEALADRHLKQIPFAGFLQPAEDRPDFLVRRVRESGARGVIMLVLKFCEIFELDAPEVRERLVRENIPVLILETDTVETVSPAMRTRIEAFLEMLRHG